MYRILMRGNLSAWRFSTIASGRTTLASRRGPFGTPLLGGSLSGRLVGRPLVGCTLFGRTLPDGTG